MHKKPLLVLERSRADAAEAGSLRQSMEEAEDSPGEVSRPGRKFERVPSLLVCNADSNGSRHQ
jgi:hypothetical protein